MIIVYFLNKTNGQTHLKKSTASYIKNWIEYIIINHFLNGHKSPIHPLFSHLGLWANSPFNFYVIVRVEVNIFASNTSYG